MKCNTNVSRSHTLSFAKTIGKNIKEEKRKRNMEMIRTTIENKRSLKKIAKNMKNGREDMAALKGGNGEIIDNHDQILGRIKQFYEQLYTPPTSPSRRSRTQKRISHPSLKQRVQDAIMHMKKGKAPGPYELDIDVIKIAGEPLAKEVTTLLNRCLVLQQVPSKWKESNLILIHKKGCNKDL